MAQGGWAADPSATPVVPPERREFADIDARIRQLQNHPDFLSGQRSKRMAIAAQLTELYRKRGENGR